MVMINVDNLEFGMVLAADIIDVSGRRLFSKGTVLNQKHLRVLKMWGVTEANIQGASANPGQGDVADKQFDPRVIRLISKTIEKQFMHNDLENEVVRELFNCCLLQKVQNYQNGDPEKQIAEMQKTLSPPSLESLVTDGREMTIKRTELGKRINNLPTLPDIYFEIEKVINDPRSSGRDIADIIAKDPGLSAKLLKLANSSYFSFRSRVETISDAVVAIGTTEIGTLAIGLTFISYFKEIPNDLINMESFWKHSIACGIAARTLGGYTSAPNLERLFLGGLLHDIGRLVLFKYEPLKAGECLRVALIENRIVFDVEKGLMGLRHTRVGKMLAEKWKLPASIENMITYHHRPLNAPHPQEPSVVYMADLLINALNIGTSGERLMPLFKNDVWQALNLSKSIFKPTMKQVNRQINEIIRFFINE